MAETGVQAYYHKIWSGRKPKCEAMRAFSPVDIVHFSSAVFIVIVGIIGSFAVLICEICLHRFSKRNAFRRFRH